MHFFPFLLLKIFFESRKNKTKKTQIHHKTFLFPLFFLLFIIPFFFNINQFSFVYSFIYWLFNFYSFTHKSLKLKSNGKGFKTKDVYCPKNISDLNYRKFFLTKFKSLNFPITISLYKFNTKFFCLDYILDGTNWRNRIFSSFLLIMTEISSIRN